MKGIRFDKKYNLLERKPTYEDSFVDVVESIIRAKEAKKITDKEASLLLSLTIKKEIKQEMKSSVRFGDDDRVLEIKTMFMNLKTKQVKHA